MGSVSCARPTVGPGRTVGGQAGSAVPWGSGDRGAAEPRRIGQNKDRVRGQNKVPFSPPPRGEPQPSLPPRHAPAHAHTHTHTRAHTPHRWEAWWAWPRVSERSKNEELGPWGLSPAPLPQRGSTGKEGRVSDAHPSPHPTPRHRPPPLLRLPGRRSRKGREEGAGLGTRGLAASRPPREGGGKLHVETDLVNIKRELWELPHRRLPVA